MLEADIRPGMARPSFLMADINHPVDLLPAFDWQPDVVFLLSAMVSRVTCEQASSLAISTNLSRHQQRAAARQAHAVAGRVLLDVGGLRSAAAIRWTSAMSHPKPNNRYGLSKLLGEQLVEYEARNARPRGASCCGRS